MIDFKKLLLFLIIAVVIAAAGLGLYWQKQWQKTHIPLDISPAAVQAKCLEDVGKMNDEQIIEKINTLPFATGEELKELSQLMYKHLRCEFFKNPFEEQYEKTKLLIVALKFSEENKSLYIENLAKYLKSAQDNREPTKEMISDPAFPLIVYAKERICPNGKEEAGLVEKFLENAARSGYSGASMEKAGITIGNYCAQIIKYSEDEFSLAREVYDFKDWPADPLERRFEYRWRIIIAFRFGGKEGALRVCGDLAKEEEKKDCQDIVDTMSKSWLIRVMRAEGCTEYNLKEVRDLICQVRGQ